MTTPELNELKATDYAAYKAQYVEFQFNPHNICNCSNCPDNEGDTTLDNYHCGQRNCWVACACCRCT